MLHLSSIHKRYGGVRALGGADLLLRRRGTIHGLIGENGSGKSTLLRVLSGEIRPDRGRILLAGEEVHFSSPFRALQYGVTIVAQETALAPDLTVTENIFLGHRMAKSRTGIDWSATRRRAAEVLGRLELDYDPDRLVRHLRPDQCQMVEIARALSLDTRILILDEPTSSLNDTEVEALFRAIKNVQQQGVCTIFVSHRLNEMFALTDELTVLRDGLTVASGPTSDFEAHTLVDAMVGQEGAWKSPERRRSATLRGGAALKVSALSAPGAFNAVNLEVAPGEIVGLAGLLGSGRSELLEAIFGVRRISAGGVMIDGRQVDVRDPRSAIKRKMGYLPPDRKIQGLIQRRPLIENATVVKNVFQNRLRPANAGEDLQTLSSLTHAMGIRAASPYAAVTSLSGGNQQKVALGKWLAAGPMVLLLDEPTRGVDVAAKSEIHRLLRDAANQRMALLVSSSENSELLDVSDRVLVMFRGQITASLTSDTATEALLARYVGGES